MPASNPERDPVVRIMMRMFDMTEQYRKENGALREMLLRRGLTQRQLRKEMNETLRNPKPQSRPDLQLQELCDGMKVFLEQNRANRVLLAEIPVSGKRQ